MPVQMCVMIVLLHAKNAREAQLPARSVSPLRSYIRVVASIRVQVIQ